jgi:hypothetical protein
MLSSYKLRQIGQRVSVSYYIDPLTSDETHQYIRHRMGIATQECLLKFDRPALKRIYTYSRGIPRIINITCDKALFMAYKFNCTSITGDIVKDVILGLTGRSAPRGREFGFPNRRRAALILAGCCLFFFILLVAYLPLRNNEKVVTERTEVKAPTIKNPERPRAISLSEPAKVSAEPNRTNIPVAQTAHQPIMKTAVRPVSNKELDKNLQLPVKMTHTVQVGAFLAEKNAETLIATMKEKGYPARIVTVTDSGGKTWYTVRVGDYSSREAAKTEANAFSAREKMETAVRPFGKF